MTGARSSDEPQPVKDAAPDRDERLAAVRERLSESYYRRPEILDRIVDALRRALGRGDSTA